MLSRRWQARLSQIDCWVGTVAVTAFETVLRRLLRCSVGAIGAIATCSTGRRKRFLATGRSHAQARAATIAHNKVGKCYGDCNSAEDRFES